MSPAHLGEKASHRTLSKIGSLAAAKSYRKAVEPGEKMVAVIRKHLIGLVVIYFQVFAGLAALIALPVLMSPDFLRDSSGKDYGILSSALVLLLIIGLLVLILATSVYRQSRLALTDKSLIQTLQHAIFHRKVSRLALSDIEDVTYEQSGIVQTLLDYGTLHIETA
ncbi:MAG: PH domain-containing protein, partial [Candidatus Saccharimonadales bacterium]